MKIGWSEEDTRASNSKYIFHENIGKQIIVKTLIYKDFLSVWNVHFFFVNFCIFWFPHFLSTILQQILARIQVLGGHDPKQSKMDKMCFTTFQLIIDFIEQIIDPTCCIIH